MPCAYILIFEKVPIFFHYYLVLEQVIKKVGKYGFRKCQVTQIGQGYLWVMHEGLGCLGIFSGTGLKRKFLIYSYENQILAPSP